MSRVRERFDRLRATPVAYTVEYRVVGSEITRVAQFRGSNAPESAPYSIASAHRRAWNFMRGIDASGGHAGVPINVIGIDSSTVNRVQ